MNNIQMIAQPTASMQANKRVELYIFIDPLCPNSFAMQATLRKLQLEYEHYFTWRYVLSTKLTSLNSLSNRIKGCFSGDDLDITHPALPSIAIKAAELQGKRAGSRYLSKLQEHATLQTKNVHSHAALTEIAQEVQLDLNEFIVDFGSKEAAHAFQCDLYITREMEVNEVPSIVFFNENVEDEGLKVSGLYNYEVYEHILQQLLEDDITRQPVPSLDELFNRFHAMTTAELASIYQVTQPVIERELKKRMLQQKIERFIKDDIVLWRQK